MEGSRSLVDKESHAGNEDKHVRHAVVSMAMAVCETGDDEPGPRQMMRE